MAALLPRQQPGLGRSAEDEEYARSQNLSRTDAVIGIDIGKNLNMSLALMNAVRLRFVRSGRRAKLKTICRAMR
jgi:hypothetical protein